MPRRLTLEFVKSEEIKSDKNRLKKAISKVKDIKKETIKTIKVLDKVSKRKGK